MGLRRTKYVLSLPKGWMKIYPQITQIYTDFLIRVHPC